MIKYFTCLVFALLISFQLHADFLQDWHQFQSAKEINLSKIGTEEFTEAEFNLIEEWGTLQFPRRRPIIPGMDDRDIRWIPYVDNKITLHDGTEMSASSITFSESQETSYHNFIATQAPVKNSVPLFWTMVWENAIDQIVMVTELTDTGIKELCYPYWPQNEENKLTFDNGMEVTLIDERWLLPEQNENIQIRRFNVSFSGENRIVTHYWYHNWPDNTAPSQTQTLLTLIQTVQQDKVDLNQHSPILAHCAAGVGRTGVFIALYHALQNSANGSKINLFDVVAQMRWQRTKMVGKLPQYQFCYKFLREVGI